MYSHTHHTKYMLVYKNHYFLNELCSGSDLPQIIYIA